MVRYLVDQPFVDYGLYHSIGDIISDASIIMNLEVKIHNGVLIPIDDEEKPIPDYLTKVHNVEEKKPLEKAIPAKPAASTAPAKAAATKPVTKATTK
jgi:hypothetical protein